MRGFVIGGSAGRVAALVVGCVGLCVTALGPTSASAGVTTSGGTAAPRAITGWQRTGDYSVSTLTGGEGVTTVTPPGGSASELYRGTASIPLGVAAEGWTHIGDPDSLNGYVFDAYQGSSTGHTKMFRVTTPSGDSYEYVHTLVSGEDYNNSFDAISPDGQWMVAGEWDTMSHLQIYPTPILNSATSPTGGTLALSGYIQLDHQVNDVQGCDFVTATELVCASDDDSESLFPEQKPLLQVDLAHPLDGGDVAGHVVDLGAIPQQSLCSGTFESEGVDYDTTTGVLRVEVIPPSVCEVTTSVYEYVQN